MPIIFVSIFTGFKVRLDLFDGPNVCSMAFSREKYRQEVDLGPMTTRSVPFIIFPLREGRHSIEVKAAVKDSWLSDGVQKTLLVAVRKLNYTVHEMCPDFSNWLSISFLGETENI